VVNPVHALGRVVARLADYRAPIEPRTTYNVGRISGGESVNVIPQHAEMHVDLRSASERELGRLEDFLLKSIHRSIAEENNLRSASGLGLRVDVALIGNRPSGDTSAASPLVRTAMAASRVAGIEPALNRASTDANVPISIGIPAITIGTGGSFGDSHRLSEWYEPEGREIGYQRALLIALAMTGVAD
jgi:acetylornithine deacetylase/succinyl-diaminopimelate desuccinylase-like protein